MIFLNNGMLLLLLLIALAQRDRSCEWKEVFRSFALWEHLRSWWCIIPWWLACHAPIPFANCHCSVPVHTGGSKLVKLSGPHHHFRLSPAAATPHLQCTVAEQHWYTIANLQYQARRDCRSGDEHRRCWMHVILDHVPLQQYLSTYMSRMHIYYVAAPLLPSFPSAVCSTLKLGLPSNLWLSSISNSNLPRSKY